MEQWKSIVGFEGIYEVSDSWDVKRIKPANRTYIGKILKVDVDKDGYHVVRLSKDKRLWARKVHRLVATAFIKNELNLPEVNHKDGVKSNNSYNNLEWCTNAQNIKHACANGLRALGEKHPSHKLNWDQVNDIRKRYVMYNGCRGNGRALAKEYGVSQHAICCIIKFKTWKGEPNASLNAG